MPSKNKILIKNQKKNKEKSIKICVICGRLNKFFRVFRAFFAKAQDRWFRVQ